MSEAMTAAERKLHEALLASGWPHPEVGAKDSLIDLGFDSLALALWVAELERHCQVRIPFAHLALDKWATIEKAARILEPVLKEDRR
jgi:acyl carrier protein